MHRFTARSAVAVTLAGSLILTVAGCKDSAASKRDDVQRQLAEIRSELQKARAAGGETAEAYQQNLTGLVSRLTSLSSGEPGQQAAKSLLAADALREIALNATNQAADIESRHRAELGVVNARIDAALRLNALASGMSSIDAASRRADLDAQLEAARTQLTALQARIGELEGPIGERTTQNQAQQQEVERLRVQVADLLKQAMDQGYSAGFDTYQQASAVKRQADKVELEIAQREIDLDHDLAPQHRMAKAQAQQVESLIQAIATAQDELDAFATAAAGDAQTTQSRVNELSKQIGADLARINSESDSELLAAYDAALAALDKAAANAQGAAKGGPEAGAGKMLGASIQESIARVNLGAAQGLADRIASLSLAKQSGGVVSVPGAAEGIKALTDARAARVEAALAALEAARQSLDSINGGGGEVEVFRANLELLTNAVSGKSAPNASVSGDDSNAGAASAVSLTPGGEGAESPEALVEALKGITTLKEAGRMFDLSLFPGDSQTQQIIGDMRTMIAGMGSLDAALQTKFGKGFADLKIPGMGEAMPTVTDAALADVTETSGTVTIKTSDGKSETLPISQVNGRWYMGSSSEPNAVLSGLMGGEDQSNASPEMQQMAKQMMASMSSMFAKTGRAMSELASSVDSGTISTFEDAKSQVQQRLQQAAQESMGGMMPGAGGK